MARLENAPFYKNAAPEKQQRIRGIIYDKVLTPLAKKHGLGQLPDRTAWINKDERGIFSSLTPTSAKLAFSSAHGALGLVKAGIGATHFVTGIDKSYLGAGKVEDFDKSLTTWMDFHFSDSLKDRALKEGGKLAGQLPAFELGDGIIGEVPYWNEKALEGMGAVGRFAVRALRDASNGALVGTLTQDDPVGSAAGFAAFGAAARPVATGYKFFKRVLGIGGAKAAKEMLEDVSRAALEKAPEVVAHPVATATAGSLKQKLTASMLLELNKVVEGGSFLNASNVQKAAALEKLGKLTPEIAEHLGAVNKDVVKAQAGAELARQRATNPDMHSILSILEKADGEKTEDTIARYTAERAKQPKIGKRGSQELRKHQAEFLRSARAIRTMAGSSVGAASTKSLEFEDNVSKLLPSTIKFEDRGHKFLAALNILVAHAREGGKVSPQDDALFRALVQHLQERYPEKTLQEMMEAGENVWKKLGEVVKASDDPAVSKWGLRFFRQSSVFSDEIQSPWKHEVELFSKSGRYAEEQGLKVGSRYRIGATKTTAELLEVGPKMSKVRLPGDKIAHVSNEQLVDVDKNIVQAQEEILKRRAARGK